MPVDTTIQTLIAAAIASGAAWLLVRPQASKIRSESALSKSQARGVELDTALKWIGQLEAKIDELEADVAQLRVEVAKEARRAARFERWARILFAQVLEAGGTPVPLDDIPGG